MELDQLQQRGQVLEDTLAEFREQPAAIDRAAIDRGLGQFDALQQSFAEWEQGSTAKVPAAFPQSDVANDPGRSSRASCRSAGGGPTACGEPGGGPGRSDSAATASDRRKNGCGQRPAREEEKFTVRVASDRLDRMLSLAGELRISQRGAEAEAGHLAGLHEQLATLGGAWERQSSQENRHSLEAAVDYVRRIQTELHQRHVREQLLLGSLEFDIREARLLPLAMLAESLRRGVRDLAQSLGKQVRYEVKVGDVLLDKAVIEALRDPLLHMLRNTAHHGLETPDERLAAGKPEEGVIVLQAVRQGDRVRVTLSDDGRGVDFARIRERVSRLGPPDGSQAAQLTEKELAAYLFRPGFTTAVTSDAISGRGVGLDVVDDAMHRLQGTVELEAGDRTGTTFALTVPVTISTVRILTVSSGGQHYGIPGSMIVRTARARRDQLRELEGSLVLTVDGEPVPWVPLADLVGAAGGVSPANGGACPYVLVAREGQRVAIAVDDMEDEAEVLLKPLGFPLTGMRGVMGGTIRPDGSVQIVLDIVSSAFRPQRGGARGPVNAAQPAVRILVVDDSPTTRRNLAKCVRRRGLRGANGGRRGRRLGATAVAWRATGRLRPGNAPFERVRTDAAGQVAIRPPRRPGHRLGQGRGSPPGPGGGRGCVRRQVHVPRRGPAGGREATGGTVEPAADGPPGSAANGRKQQST